MTKKTQPSFKWIYENNVIESVNDLLKSKWINSVEEFKEKFLSWTYKERKNSYKDLPDIEKFLTFIKKVKDNNENILIFWDYDVDGVSWAAVLYKGFIYYWIPLANIDFILPNRDIWYSIKKAYVDEYLNNEKRKLRKIDNIITVDCWINSWKEITDIVQTYWIKVWVSDHHQIDEAFSEFSEFNINPHRIDSIYPFKKISGSLVALKLIEWIHDIYGFEKWDIEELEDIACLWVVADVTPIENENFYLTRDCLKRYHESKNKWIRYLTKNLWNKDINKNWETADLIWWRIAPRINAVWRLDEPTKSLYMLLNWNDEKLKLLYDILDSTNKKRQEFQEEALKDLKVDASNKIIIIALEKAKDWLIWLISGKVKEQYNKPTLCFTKTNWFYKGSWRSVWKVDILWLFKQVKHLAIWGWWHKMAMGCSVEESKFEEFRNELIKLANDTIKDEDLVKEVHIQGILNFTKLDTVFRKILTRGFAPYAYPNNKPIFLLDWIVKEVKILKEVHTKLIIKDKFWWEIEILKWNELLNIEPNDKIEVIWEYTYSEFNNKITDNLTLIDYYIK